MARAAKPSGGSRPPGSSKKKTTPVRKTPRPWYLSWYFWLAILVVVGLIVWRLLPSPGVSPDDGAPRAAIVDQLYSFGYPNPSFIETITASLEGDGFKVDLYQGEDVTTVSTYKNILADNYSVVIFRAHSGLIQTPGEPVRTSIFTSEEYSAMASSCSSDVAAGRLVKARVSDGDPFYFAITSDFVEHYMSGMKNSVVILSGCSGLSPSNTDMAEAFFNNGAGAYLGWNGSVDLSYVDRATTAFFEVFCSGELTLAKAVDEVMKEVGGDPHWGSHLGYFPEGVGEKTLYQLCGIASSVVGQRE